MDVGNRWGVGGGCIDSPKRYNSLHAKTNKQTNKLTNKNCNTEPHNYVAKEEVCTC